MLLIAICDRNLSMIDHFGDGFECKFLLKKSPEVKFEPIGAGHSLSININ